MSHYTRLETQFQDRECLVKALADIGYAKLEEGEKLALYGYHGDKRKETAEIVIRRQNIGASSNDVGFALQGDGSYQAIVSEFDHSSGFCWNRKQGELKQQYALHTLDKACRAKGFAFGGVVRNSDGSLSVMAERRKAAVQGFGFRR